MGSRPRLDHRERRARLGWRHRLAPDRAIDDVARVADDLVALHATDPVSVFLSAAARMAQPRVAGIERSLYDDRRLLRHHAMRRTLWLMTPPVAAAAHAAATRKVAAAERRKLLALLGAHLGPIDPAAWLADAEEAIVAEVTRAGRLTTRALGAARPDLTIALSLAPGTAYAATQGAHSRVAQQLGFEARLVRGRPVGSWISGQYHWEPPQRWFPPGFDPEAGVGETEAAIVLTRRWLQAFGPATSADLQWWMGWTKTLTARALAGAGAIEVELEDGETGWVGADDLEPTAETAWVALLPGLDPTTMGWKQRSWYVDPEMARSTFDRNGNAGPTVWVNGRVVGGWVQAPDGEIRIRLLTDVGGAERDAIDQAAARLVEFVGEARFSVRFASPLCGELLRGWRGRGCT